MGTGTRGTPEARRARQDLSISLPKGGRSYLRQWIGRNRGLSRPRWAPPQQQAEAPPQTRTKESGYDSRPTSLSVLESGRTSASHVFVRRRREQSYGIMNFFVVAGVRVMTRPNARAPGVTFRGHLRAVRGEGAGRSQHV